MREIIIRTLGQLDDAELEYVAYICIHLLSKKSR